MTHLRQGYGGQAPALETLAPCFQGIIPAMLFTCAKDGTPNAAYLSHVDYVDGRHVALSFQFFNKSRRNISENPNAFITVLDPDTSQGWGLRLKFVRSETSGPIFERMALRIEAIASYSGLKGIFKLRAADIYEVTAIEAGPTETGNPEAIQATRDRHAQDPVFTMRALQDLSQRINAADCIEGLLESILAGIEELFGFNHSMILLTGEQPGTLVTIATRGYPEGGAGAEARIGEGIIGLVAEAQKPIRISGLLRGMLYAHATRGQGHELPVSVDRRIPLPGLQNPMSQLGVPMLVRGELIGVLCIESELPYRFHEEDKTSIELLGSYLAIAIQNMQLREQQVEPVTDLAVAPNAAETAAGRAASARREIAYYKSEECILVDGEYLIRSLPARILWKLLSVRETEGRDEFTNRELRLDKSLNLPEFKDNLETRLLLLRRRLEEKSLDIRLVPRARGRFALELNAAVTLVERP